MTEYYVWLNLCLGAGNAKAYNIIKEYGELKDFYNAAKSGKLKKGFLNDREQAQVKLKDIGCAEEVMEDCNRLGITIITPKDIAYPERLKNIYAPPVCLYVKGDITVTDRNVAVAVIGNRKASDYGTTAARQIGFDIAKAGAVVVSGMAAGVDTAAHNGAIEANGKTVAVLGCGIDVPYPKQNAQLLEQIAQHGGVISEYPPGTQPASENFPTRNRIISGLSLGVAVVEAGVHSGSLITANLALEQGRDIFTVPNSVFSDRSAGSLKLLRDGAIPVGCAYDILVEYKDIYGDKITIDALPKRYYGSRMFELDEIPPKTPPKKRAPKAAEQKQLTIGDITAPQKPEVKKEPLPEYISQNAVKVYGILSADKIHLDEISARLSLTASQVLAAITELEIEELVTSYAGRFYSV